MDIKSLKKKWTDITIALALPLVVWNGATGIYNQWEEVQDEKDVPRMIAAQRFDDMLFVWHIWCNDAISTTDQPDEGVKTACEQIPPVGTSYEEFQTFPKDSFVFGNNSSKELRKIAADEYNIPFMVDTADDVITQRSAKQTFDIVLGHIFNPIKRFKDGVGDVVNKVWSIYVYDVVK